MYSRYSMSMSGCTDVRYNRSCNLHTPSIDPRIAAAGEAHEHEHEHQHEPLPRLGWKEDIYKKKLIFSLARR